MKGSKNSEKIIYKKIQSDQNPRAVLGRIIFEIIKKNKK